MGSWHVSSATSMAKVCRRATCSSMSCIPKRLCVITCTLTRRVPACRGRSGTNGRSHCRAPLSLPAHNTQTPPPARRRLPQLPQWAGGRISKTHSTLRRRLDYPALAPAMTARSCFPVTAASHPGVRGHAGEPNAVALSPPRHATVPSSHSALACYGASSS